MSAWTAEMDALITLFRGVTGLTLPTGDQGAEKGVRPGAELRKDDLPHLFIFAPRTIEVQLDFRQRDLRTTYETELWFEDTQDNVSAIRDNIKTAIEADRSLGGLVEDLHINESAILETAESDERRVLTMQLETFVLEG